MQTLRRLLLIVAACLTTASARAADAPLPGTPAAPVSTRFAGPEISQGQRFRVIDMPADDPFYPSLENMIGETCIALTPMKASSQPGFYSGDMRCRKKLWNSQTVAVQLLAPGEAADPVSIPYAGGPIRKYQKFRILDASKEDAFRRDDLLGSICVAASEMREVRRGWYGGNIVCAGIWATVKPIAVELLATPLPVVWTALPPPFNAVKAKRFKGASVGAKTAFRVVEASPADAALFGVGRGLAGHVCVTQESLKAVEPGWFAGKTQCDSPYQESFVWTKVAIEVVEPPTAPIPPRPANAGPTVRYTGNVIPAFTAFRLVDATRRYLFTPQLGRACTTGVFPVRIAWDGAPFYGEIPFAGYCEGKEVGFQNIGVELVDPRTGAPLRLAAPAFGVLAMDTDIASGARVRIVEIDHDDPLASAAIELVGTTCVVDGVLKATGAHYAGKLTCVGPYGKVVWQAARVQLDLLDVEPPQVYRPASGRPVTRFAGPEIPVGQRFRVIELSSADVKGTKHLGALLGAVCVPTRDAMRPSKHGPALFSGGALCNEILNGFLEGIGVELVGANAAPENGEGHFAGGQLLAGQRFVIVDVGPEEKKDPKRTVVIGKHCVATEEMSRARSGKGLYGGQIRCEGVRHYAPAVRVYLEDTVARATWSVILPPFKAEGPVRFMGETFPEGSNFRVVEASEPDRERFGADRGLVGLPCRGDTMILVEPGWWSGEANCGSRVGDKTNWTKVAIEIEVRPATIPPRPAGLPVERFTGTRIPGLTAFRIVEVDPRDKKMASRTDAVGLACISTIFPLQIDSSLEPLYEGRAICNGKSEEFWAVAVELIDATTGAPLAIKTPPPGRPLAKEDVPKGTTVRITSMNITDGGIDTWNDWIGSTCEASTTLRASGNKYAGVVNCTGPYGPRTWVAKQLTLETVE